MVRNPGGPRQRNLNASTGRPGVPPDGRLPEATNGSFVEANCEKPALSIGQLWRNATGGSGSASDSRVSDLTAGKLTPKLSDQTADVRGRQ